MGGSFQHSVQSSQARSSSSQQAAVPRYCFRTGLIGAKLLFVAVRHAAATCQASAAGRSPGHFRSPTVQTEPTRPCRPVHRFAAHRNAPDGNGMGWRCHATRTGRGSGQGFIPPGLGLAARRIRLPECLVVPTAPPPPLFRTSVCLVFAQGGSWPAFRGRATGPRLVVWWECHTGGLVVEA